MVRYAARRLFGLPLKAALITGTSVFVAVSLLVGHSTVAQDALSGLGPDVVAAGSQEQVYAVTVTKKSKIFVRVCRPATQLPARLVVINHGSPVKASDRARTQLGRCDQEATQWFLAKGYVVAMPLRRGYGISGGAWAEDYGPCNFADYFHAGLETARDISATVEALTTLPFVRSTGVIIVGQSAGGWGTIAYDSVAHPPVAAFIVMAGGRGGHMRDQPNQNCHPDRLVQAAGQYGAKATTPMLWVYARNDSFFGPVLAQAMYQSFTARGGKADFEQPERFDGDGHRLFLGRGGSMIWGPLVERYLAQQLPSGN